MTAESERPDASQRNGRGLGRHRHAGTVVGLLSFLAVSLATRVALTIRVWGQLDGDHAQLVRSFAWGALYDLAAACFATAPIALLPQRVFASRGHRKFSKAMFFAWLYGLMFIAVAEWMFWSEFHSRFNFIAVDYLIYTREVVGNIIESFSVVPILIVLFGVTLGIGIALRRSGWLAGWGNCATPLRKRIPVAAILLVAACAFHRGLDGQRLPEFSNHLEMELARNGAYAFFGAFRSSSLDFATFYPTMDPTDAFRRMRRRLVGDTAPAQGETSESLWRRVSASGPERRWNIVQITVESLSAKYLAAFGGKRGLTPNLDALAQQGVLFTNFRATGYRTVRGIEALTLGLPPTPGRSVVKRPGSSHLFSFGSVLRRLGYDTVFLYGGYAYFDNMKGFFRGNGYRVVDRTSVDADAITFANIWGASDEDVFGWAIDEADRVHASGQPFFQFVMTTSNHRPYTYPDGRIDIPSHTGRTGGVKYSDWAIGDYFRRVKDKPWFDGTIFVIVADHCAGTSGRVALPPERYEIPLILYAPKILEPRVEDRLSSQIDLPPTLLSMLGADYDSEFFGRDIFSMGPEDERALISTYQSLGYLTKDHLLVLSPVKRAALFRYDRATREVTPVEMDDELRQDAIAIYQTADALLESGRYRPASESR